MAFAVHGARRSDVNGFAPRPPHAFDNRRDDCRRCQAAIAANNHRRLATSIVRGASCQPLRNNMAIAVRWRPAPRNSPGKLDGDPPGQIWAQLVDCQIADSFRMKQRPRGLRADFCQLAFLSRGESDTVVAPRTAAAGGVKVGQSAQMNGARNRAGLARTAVLGNGKVVDHARYFR